MCLYGCFSSASATNPHIAIQIIPSLRTLRVSDTGRSRPPVGPGNGLDHASSTAPRKHPTPLHPRRPVAIFGHNMGPSGKAARPRACWRARAAAARPAGAGRSGKVARPACRAGALLRRARPAWMIHGPGAGQPLRLGCRDDKSSAQDGPESAGAAGFLRCSYPGRVIGWRAREDSNPQPSDP